MFGPGGLTTGTPVCGGAEPCTCPTERCLYRVVVGEQAYNPVTHTVKEWDGTRWVVLDAGGPRDDYVPTRGIGCVIPSVAGHK